MTWAVNGWKTCAVLATAVVLGGLTASHSARASVPQATERGVTKRSSLEGSLTAEDNARLRELGLTCPQSAVVILRKIPKSEGGRQFARLRALARAPEGMAASGACDEVLPQGEASALCRGHVRGPFGSVAVRMPIAARLTERDGGSLQLLLHNPRPLEVKGLFSWSSVVAPENLVIAYELLPDPDGWLVYVRVAVQMSAHQDSARTISDTMLKVESWLTRELARL
jgi:hypothetical protein